MRQKKINEINEMLKGDPRNKPMMIYFSQGKSIVNYHNRSLEIIEIEEAKKLIAMYPDVLVLKIVYEKQDCDL